MRDFFSRTPLEKLASHAACERLRFAPIRAEFTISRSAFLHSSEHRSARRALGPEDNILPREGAWESADGRAHERARWAQRAAQSLEPQAADHAPRLVRDRVLRNSSAHYERSDDDKIMTRRGDASTQSAIRQRTSFSSSSHGKPVNSASSRTAAVNTSLSSSSTPRRTPLPRRAKAAVLAEAAGADQARGAALGGEACSQVAV